MTVSGLARAALVITTASAVTLNTGGFSMKTDLPRIVVQTAEEDGCGRNLTGYLLTGPGLLWSDHTLGNAKSVIDCRQKCDSTSNCVGFTARYPRRGKMQCNLYKGLVKKHDSRSMAYSKCLKGFKCADGKDFPGFQFSHEGTWKDGVKEGDKTLRSCSTACKHSRSCVGFVYRVNKAGAGECYHFNNAANELGPQRDMRANTYSKCSLLEQTPIQAPAGDKPSLPLSTMMLRSTQNVSCSSGYMASSKGWWWPEYDTVSEVADMQACARGCDSAQECVSFVYRPYGTSSECYLYAGIETHVESTSVAFTKCPQQAPCDESSILDGLNVTNGHFKFSHYGSWVGGTQMSGIGSKACNVICSSDPTCNAFSWKRTSEICTTYSFNHSSSKDATPILGAEGYAKCTNVDVAELQASELQASKRTPTSETQASLISLELTATAKTQEARQQYRDAKALAGNALLALRQAVIDGVGKDQANAAWKAAVEQVGIRRTAFDSLAQQYSIKPLRNLSPRKLS